MTTKPRKKEYAIWIWIDKTFPWIELEGTYETLQEAVHSSEKFRDNLKVKIVEISQPHMKKEVLAVPLIKT